MKIHSAARVLITSPSLHVTDNVSGISSLVSEIVQFSKCNVIHFLTGSKDNERKDFFWVIRQLHLYLKFLMLSINNKYNILHLNTGLEKPSICRDYLLMLIAKKIFRKKIILHVHGGYYLMNNPRSKLINYLIQKLIKNAHAVIVLSEVEKNILTKRYGAYNYSILANAVDTNNHIPQRDYKLNNILNLVFLGRINNTKGIFIISETIGLLEKYLDKFQLKIYGKGPGLEPWIKSLEKHPKLIYSYEGVIGGKDKWRMLSETDVLLLPSLHSEGLPIAMIEAMTAGCVVIVTDDGSITTVVRDNETGLIIPKNSSQQLADKIIKIINGTIDLQRIGTNAKNYVLRNLTFSNYICKLDKLYKAIY